MLMLLNEEKVFSLVFPSFLLFFFFFLCVYVMLCCVVCPPLLPCRSSRARWSSATWSCWPSGTSTWRSWRSCSTLTPPPPPDWPTAPAPAPPPPPRRRSNTHTCRPPSEELEEQQVEEPVTRKDTQKPHNLLTCTYCRLLSEILDFFFLFFFCVSLSTRAGK